MGEIPPARLPGLLPLLQLLLVRRRRREEEEEEGLPEFGVAFRPLGQLSGARLPGSSSYSSEREKRVLGKRASGGMDGGSELKGGGCRVREAGAFV